MGQALLELAPSVGGGATTDLGRLAQAGSSGAEATTDQLMRGITKASSDLDPRGLQGQLDRALATLGLARCVEEIVIPATRLLRGLRMAGERDAAQDLMAIEAIRTWLSTRSSFAPAPRDVGPILLACGARETQVVGLESLALLLRFQRWPCQVLGSRVSTFRLKIAAQAAGAVGVVVISNEKRGWPRAVVLLRTVEALDVPVFYSGDSFESADARRQVPGRYLGNQVQGACVSLITALEPASSG